MKKKVIVGVFENDSLNRLIYKRMVSLQPGVIEAHIFEDHQVGSEQVHQIKPDLLFVDLHMHGEYLGGVEWLKNAKELLPNTRFVAMTTLMQKDDTLLATEAGFTRCVEKPLPFHDLEKLLEDSMN
ncbi:MAG: response regulator [Cyclobacteriaceae bacterium]|nr:response regulator [Cyclobacteriaceae bacterium]